MKVRISIVGTAPLIMHNIRLANPLDEIAKEMKKISGKRSKTEDDYEALAKLEFFGGMYHDATLGPYLPGVNIERTVTEGARASKQGKKAESGFFVLDDRIPVAYKGSRDVAVLQKDPNFVSVMPVRVGQARIMRTRPIFREWALDCEAEIDLGMLSMEDLESWANTAGATKGLGDYRPRYGRFEAKVERI